jgi:hypothetical protein
MFACKRVDASEVPIAQAEATQAETTEKVAGQAKTVVPVQRSLFIGKAPEAARDALRDKGYSAAVIAFVLVKHMKVPKYKAGHLLEADPVSADKAKKHGKKDPKTYRTAVNALLKEANYINVVET